MRYLPIPSDFFAANRKNVSQRLEPGSVALVCSSYQMPRNGDQYYPYRQNSDFFYLTGIEQEKSLLLLAPDSLQPEYRELLFILRSTPKMEIWEGKKLTLQEASEISGIAQVYYLDELEGILDRLMAEMDGLYVNTSLIAAESKHPLSQDAMYAEKLRIRYPNQGYRSLQTILQALRLIKSDIEITLLREAIAITRETFLEVLQAIRPGNYEFEIEALIYQGFIRRRASGHAYEPIVASGANACYLHYTRNCARCQSGDLVLLDFGAEYANYAADLSRTIPVNGRYSKRQRELYDSVLRTFYYARSLMKPGITINQLNSEVGRWVQEEHVKLGLYTTGSIKAHQGENPLWHNFYMHGTSHFLGLDVHDVGTKDQVLQPGMVLTCEPGIYIADEGIGIRTENNILITSEGYVDLMENIPIEADDIEQRMHHT